MSVRASVGLLQRDWLPIYLEHLLTVLRLLFTLSKQEPKRNYFTTLKSLESCQQNCLTNSLDNMYNQQSEINPSLSVFSMSTLPLGCVSCYIPGLLVYSLWLFPFLDAFILAKWRHPHMQTEGFKTVRHKPSG